MAVMTISPKEALRKQFIEAYILEKMNPNLGFLNLFPRVNLQGATSFKMFTDETSAEDEIIAGNMGEPVDLGELSRLPTIKVHPIESKLGDVKRFGFSLRFSQDIENQNTRIDEIMRALDMAGYNMLRTLNKNYLKTITTYAKAEPITLNDGSWTTSNKISEDIIDMQKSFDILGYDYNLTNMYIGKESWYGTKKYYNALDEAFTPNDIEGSSLSKVDELETGLIGLDNNIKPITTYYNVNSKYSTFEGSFINVNKYEEERYPYQTVIDIWAEMGLGVRHPRAMLYQEGV